MRIDKVVEKLAKENPLSVEELNKLAEKVMEYSGKLNRELDRLGYVDPIKLLYPMTH